MYCVRKVTDDLYWVGADDRRLELFENIHPIPQGISYNSYLLLDEKTVLVDTVDWSVGRQFIENIEHVLDGRKLDYLIINHMEPDHASTMGEILKRYPEAVVIATKKASTFMAQFGFNVEGRLDVVKEGDVRSFGKHEFTFINAPMVHWPEVMMSFDTTTGILFSADAFGSFKTLDGHIFNDEVDYDRYWIDESRRYYSNIVGKYGKNVQNVLKKASKLDIKMICPLHGLVWRSNIDYLLDKYQKWSTYEPEEKGVVIAYASVYGDTECAVQIIASKLAERGITKVELFDVSKTDNSYIISEIFKYSHLVLASTTYNLGIFPKMEDLLNDMKGLAVQNRTAAIVENGTWACKSGSLIADILGEMKNIRLLESKVSLASSLCAKNGTEIDSVVDALAADINA